MFADGAAVWPQWLSRTVVAFGLALVGLTGCVTETQRIGAGKLEATVVSRGGYEASTPTGMVHWWGDPAGRRTAGGASLSDAAFDPAVRQDRAGSGQDPEDELARRRAELRSVFGPSILIGADGRVTKQYFLAGDLGPRFLKLITEISPEQPPPPDAPVPPPGTAVGGDGSQSILGRMLGGRQVEVTYLAQFEAVRGVRIVDDPRPNTIGAVTGEAVAPDPNKGLDVALLLVTGDEASLTAFEGALDLFYTSIPQVEITVQVIEYSTADALAFGVTGIDTGAGAPPNLANLSSGQLVQAYTSIFPLRQPLVGASPVTDVGLFTLGGIHDSWELNMVLEALEANNLADIQSSPKLVVRNGGVAAISTLTQIPVPKAKINQLGSQVATDIEFKPVGVKMNIVPVIAGTDSVLLQVFADVSLVTAFANTDPVVTPIVSNRTAVTSVYLRNQHSLVIGGLKSITQIESETKVPILGDIPLLGFLFRSTSSSREETSVAFQITPRIVEDRGQRVLSEGEF